MLRHPCSSIGAAVNGFLYGLTRGYDYVVRQDGDMTKHDAAQIPRLLEVLRAGGADIVVGSRFLAREGYQSTLVRRVGIFVLGIVSRLVGTRVTDPTSGYWAVNRRALQVLAHQHPDDYPETEALVMASRAGCRVTEVPVVMYARIAGESSISTLYSGFYMLKVVLALLVGRLRPR
ncbi:MAG: glycosyltransferase family 2 protein [Candidatus Binatia bacterium]